MDKVTIVGSGASGVHFALSLLRKNYDVVMLDVGNKKPDPVLPNKSYKELKSNLEDPVAYFLGKNFEAVIYPDEDSEYYGFPPNKNYVFKKPSLFDSQSNGFAPLFSFAQGGLAEVWTGGVYPLNDYELSDFPFSYKEIEPYYNEVAERIGISGAKDDLSQFLPLHDNIMEPLSIDEHSDLLISAYQKKKSYLNKKLNCYIGRSRVAALKNDKDGRKACTYSGRCLWGCPAGALYTPSMTLSECRKYSNFHYVQNIYVEYFRFNSKHRIVSVVAKSTSNGQSEEFSIDKLVLAAGTLSTSKIFLESIHKNSGEFVKLQGLMDNRQVLIPFVNFKMACKPYNAESYQYHQLAMGLNTHNSKEYVHGQITTLKTSMIHPIIQKIPFDLKTSIYFFKNFHSALGIINLNFHDYRRNDNYVSLINEKKTPESALYIKYNASNRKPDILRNTIKTIKKVLFKLGCIVPPGTVHIRPMGASVHYSGTIPMNKSKGEFTTTEYCRSNDFKNLYIVDGSTFPFLPAKNLTFTLMANAIRVAENAF